MNKAVCALVCSKCDKIHNMGVYKNGKFTCDECLKKEKKKDEDNKSELH